MRQILEGIRIVDWTLIAAGPYASSVLADMGAEVIHVEIVDGGDFFRGIQSFYGTRLTLPHGRHAPVENINRNKKSLAVDLKQPEGREIICKLVSASDVFMTNFRRRARESLRLDYETLKQYNPKLIYASASAFGEEGPLKDNPGLEMVACAASGAMAASGDVGEPPSNIAPGFGDHCCGIYFAHSVVSALLARERFGIGQEVKTSQLGAMVALQGVNVITYLLTGEAMHRHDRKTEPNPLYNYYRCSDDRWLAFAEQRESGWPVICQAMQRLDLQKDVRFATLPARMANAEVLIRILDEELAKRPSHEWIERIQNAGDLIFSPINTIPDVANDPQVLTNNYVIPYQHPVLGDVRILGFPISYSETPTSVRMPAPELGEHTESILLDTLGYDWEQIGVLKEKRVIL